jgi:hypothetical protein
VTLGEGTAALGESTATVTLGEGTAALGESTGEALGRGDCKTLEPLAGCLRMRRSRDRFRTNVSWPSPTRLVATRRGRSTNADKGLPYSEALKHSLLRKQGPLEKQGPLLARPSVRSSQAHPKRAPGHLARLERRHPPSGPPRKLDTLCRFLSHCKAFCC